MHSMNPTNENEEQKPSTYNDVTPPAAEPKPEPVSLEQNDEVSSTDTGASSTEPVVAPVVGDQIAPAVTPEQQPVSSSPAVTDTPNQTVTGAPEGVAATTPSQPAAQPMFVQKDKSKTTVKNKKFIAVVVALVLLAVAGTAGAYLWQNQQVQSLSEENTKLSTQLAAAQKMTNAKQTTEQATPAGTVARSQEQADYRLVAGTVDLNKDNTRQADSIYIEPYMMHDGELEEIWLEYGTSPSSLTEQTERESEEIGMGDVGTYRQWPFALKKSSFESGKTYFYRVAAKNGSTVIYSGVAAFTATK